jgi:hypothetical protein
MSVLHEAAGRVGRAAPRCYQPLRTLWHSSFGFLMTTPPNQKITGAPIRVVKRVVIFPSGFSFQATLAARSATEWSGVARASGGLSIATRARLFSLARSRRSFSKSFWSFFLLFLRPFLRAVNLRACLIGVAALSCVGPRAPRTSSYPDS